MPCTCRSPRIDPLSNLLLRRLQPPTSPETLAKPAYQTGQKEHIGFGQRSLTVAPGNFFNDDGAPAAAIDTAHGVQQEDEESPERNEFIAVRRVDRSRAPADGSASRSRPSPCAVAPIPR